MVTICEIILLQRISESDAKNRTISINFCTGKYIAQSKAFDVQGTYYQTTH